MSNITRRFAVIFLCLSIVGTANAQTVDRERLKVVEDDTRLLLPVEKTAREYLFDILRRYTQTELKNEAVAEAGFVNLNLQPKEYRGRLVTLRGRLHRCEFIPTKREPLSEEGEISGEPPKSTGFYMSWILLKDEKQRPVTVCSLEIPEGFPLGEKLDEKKGEQVELTGFFFKRHRYHTKDGEEITAPALLAKTFSWSPETTQKQSTRWIDRYFWHILIVLAVTWITMRTITRRAAMPIRRKTEPEFDGKIVIPENNEQQPEGTHLKQRPEVAALPEIVVPLFLAMILTVTAPSLAQEPPKIDAEFTKTLLRMDDYAWDALGDEKIPLEQQQEEVVNMMHELRTTVPRGFLKRETTPLPSWFSILATNPKPFRGKAFRLEGTVTFVEELPLNPVQRKIFQLPMFFRCRLLLFEHSSVELLTPTVPVAWKRNEPISENAAVTGLYIKRLQMDDESLIPLFAAPDIEWYPDTPLGNIGMNVASLDQIPVLRITDRNKKELDVAEPLQMLDRSEVLRRAFKFTVADRGPFYGLLHAAKNLADTTLPSDIPAPLLFTEPEKHRNKLVHFHGTAKRVIPILVDDKEIQELYGITKYYQIYFYTKDSQGNPLIASVTELPEGMPVGSDDKYAEQISITGFFYKLWIYESAALIEKEGGEFYKPAFAPLLIGHSPEWTPKKPTAKGPGPIGTLSLATFACLAVVWYVLRRLRSTKPIEFKLDR